MDKCIVCKRLIPESRKKSFPNRKIVTCSGKCSRIREHKRKNNDALVSGDEQ